MQVKFSNRGTTLIAGISGELDHHSADHLREKLDAELMKSTTKNLVFDFSKVSFMDSAGIGVVMGRFKNIQKLNGKAAIVGVSPQIRRVFEISGVLRMIPLFDSVSVAVNELQ